MLFITRNVCLIARWTKRKKKHVMNNTKRSADIRQPFRSSNRYSTATSTAAASSSNSCFWV